MANGTVVFWQIAFAFGFPLGGPHRTPALTMSFGSGRLSRDCGDGVPTGAPIPPWAWEVPTKVLDSAVPLNIRIKITDTKVIVV